MSAFVYDSAYYAALLILLTCYFLTFRTHLVGNVSSFFFFRNASVLYFSVFSVLLGKFVYDGSALSSAEFSENLYFLMLYYGIVLILVATAFNFLPPKDRQVEKFNLNILPLVLVLGAKCALFAVETTPFQTFVLGGLVEAHIQQANWHTPGQGGIVKSFYVYGSAIMTVLFFIYYVNSSSRVMKLGMLLLAFETSGFYLSKSGMFTPIIVGLILSGVKLRYQVIFALAGMLSVFALRLGAPNLWSNELLLLVLERFVLETGYSNLHLGLFQAEYPPLGYESRYFIGFNTLFGITPAVDASREAYLIETGRYGATTSGHAAVSLYAFWGYGFYVVLPILVSFILFMDKLIINRIRTTFGVVAYVFMTFKAINFLTVDLQRLVSFQTIIDLTFLSSVALILVAGKVLSARIFRQPIVLYQEYRTQHA